MVAMGTKYSSVRPSNERKGNGCEVQDGHEETNVLRRQCTCRTGCQKSCSSAAAGGFSGFTLTKAQTFRGPSNQHCCDCINQITWKTVVFDSQHCTHIAAKKKRRSAVQTANLIQYGAVGLWSDPIHLQAFHGSSP